MAFIKSPKGLATTSSQNFSLHLQDALVTITINAIKFETWVTNWKRR
jgi:hypothetical protein